jgi:hypothetical protein
MTREQLEHAIRAACEVPPYLMGSLTKILIF